MKDLYGTANVGDMWRFLCAVDIINVFEAQTQKYFTHPAYQRVL